MDYCLSSRRATPNADEDINDQDDENNMRSRQHVQLLFVLLAVLVDEDAPEASLLVTNMFMMLSRRAFASRCSARRSARSLAISARMALWAWVISVRKVAMSARVSRDESSMLRCSQTPTVTHAVVKKKTTGAICFVVKAANSATAVTVDDVGAGAVGRGAAGRGADDVMPVATGPVDIARKKPLHTLLLTVWDASERKQAPSIVVTLTKMVTHKKKSVRKEEGQRLPLQNVNDTNHECQPKITI